MSTNCAFIAAVAGTPASSAANISITSRFTTGGKLKPNVDPS